MIIIFLLAMLKIQLLTSSTKKSMCFITKLTALFKTRIQNIMLSMVKECKKQSSCKTGKQRKILFEIGIKNEMKLLHKDLQTIRKIKINQHILEYVY